MENLDTQEHVCFLELAKQQHVNLSDSFALLYNWRKGNRSGYGIRVKADEPTKSGKTRRKNKTIIMRFCPMCGKEIYKQDGE
jgi:hypothetical protein